MLSRLKRRVALLSALVLAATTLALVPASPASAAVKVPLAMAQFSACPTSASIPSAGFTDTTSTDVDCIAYYGITTGTTATTYSPTESVTRWQMALYLTRAAGPAGVTLGAGTDDGTFTDISGKSDEIKTAIMQIKDLGITIGTTATTYSPDDNVSREEMALFINRFLAKATLGPGGANDSVADNDGLMAATVGSASTTTNYTDIGTGTTYEGRNAITNLWHMGITDDPSSTSTVYSTTYSPAADMTRSSMATFMVAALAHTNARPKGVALQSSLWDSTGQTEVTAQGAATPTLSASYRADDFTAAAGTPIDVFYWTNSTAEGNTDFLATGLCNTTYTAPASNAVTECYIDAGDVDTDANGNTVPTVPAHAAGSTTDYWAWTAADATSYDNDVHASDASKITIASNYDATDFSVTTDIPSSALTSEEADAGGVAIYPHIVKFGTDVTISFDATWYYPTTVVDYATNHKSLPITVRHERWVTDSGATTVYADNALIIDATSIIYTDASGDASFTISSPTDLSTTVGNDEVTDKITVTSGTLDFYDGNVLGQGSYNDWGFSAANGSSTSATGSIHIQWHDDAPAMASGALTQSSYYGALSTAGVTRTATYTAYDQYGAAWTGGEAVVFSSSSTLPSMALGASAPITADEALGLAANSGLGSDTWTTTAAHGLSVGDVVYASAASSTGCLPSTVTLNTEALTVAVVTSTTTFSLTDADGDIVLTDIDCSDAGEGIDFTLAFQDEFTTTTDHGLAAGDVVYATADTNGCLPSTVTLVTEALTVAVVTTSTTFSLTDGSSNDVLTDADCSAEGEGLTFVADSTANASRTTGAAGTASVTWSDTEGTSGLDTITVNPGTVSDPNGNTIGSSTSKYYRTLAETATTSLATTGNACDAADQTAEDWCAAATQAAGVTSATDTDIDADTMAGGTAFWDDTANVIVAIIHYGDEGEHEPITVYMPYWYDDNDQFTYDATASTMAAWEGQLRAFHTNGVTSYPATAVGAGGLSGVDYENLSTGISIFKTD